MFDCLFVCLSVLLLDNQVEKSYCSWLDVSRIWEMSYPFGSCHTRLYLKQNKTTTSKKKQPKNCKLKQIPKGIIVDRGQKSV